MRHLSIASLVLVFAACSHVARNDDCPPPWNYQQQALWPAACIEGPSRSPINITTTRSADFPQIAFHYTPFVPRMYNNHRGVKFYADNRGGSVTVTGADGRPQEFSLQELHFHVQSEHTFGSRPAPMELHMVNQDAAGNAKVVVAILFDDSTTTVNAGLREVASILPTTTCRYITPSSSIDPMKLLPDLTVNRAYYVYDGALTTPACDAGLTFFVFASRTMTNRDQVALISRVIAPNFKTIGIRELPMIPVIQLR